MRNSGYFRADLEKYYRIEFGGRRPTFWRKAKLWATHLGLHCVAIYRLFRYSRSLLLRRRLWAAPLYILSELLAFQVRFFHHVDIFAAEIGPGFYIGHLGTIYIGKTRIGGNVSVTHNLTIGTGITDGSHRLPTLGSNVWIGSGSVLYGNVHIGDGVTVNSGTVLSRSVPDGCLVGGNPGRIILKYYDNSRLFGFAPAPTLPAPDTPAADPLPEPSEAPGTETRRESLRQ